MAGPVRHICQLSLQTTGVSTNQTYTRSFSVDINNRRGEKINLKEKLKQLKRKVKTYEGKKKHMKERKTVYKERKTI